MDRRRFVPSSEGLEGRALLSGLFSPTPTNLLNNPSADVPPTFKLKAQRIERLPYFMDQLQPGRDLPAAVIKPLQADMFTIAAKLQPPGPPSLNAFNHQIRDTLTRQSLSPERAAVLNTAFRDVVRKTGAPPQSVANLQQDLNNLARIDANSPNPVYLATNDYSLILQTILGIGRPITTPTVPFVAGTSGARNTLGGGIATTHQPTLVGIYAPGATIDAGTKIQVVDAAGAVFGSGNVQSTGKYRITFDHALNDGRYTFHVRAVDAQGDVSNFSQAFKLVVRVPNRLAQVNLPPPGGPLGLR